MAAKLDELVRLKHKARTEKVSRQRLGDYVADLLVERVELRSALQALIEASPPSRARTAARELLQ